MDMDDEAPKQEQSQTEQAETDRQDGQTTHSNITYVDTQVEIRKASEPTVDYGGKVSEPRAEYTARKPEKTERAEKSGRPFRDKLEAKKSEVANGYNGKIDSVDSGR